MVPNPERPEQYALQIDGLLRLASARDILDLVVGGRWTTSPAVVGAVVDLVAAAQQRFLWAEAVAA